MHIPLGTPICLKAHTGNNLQNEFFWRNARCKNSNTEALEQIVLLKTHDGKIIIQSRWNNRNLQVRPSGECVFVNHNQDLWEKFDVECSDDGKVFFISCHTGMVLQCDENGIVRCANKNRESWESWSIIFPETTEMITEGHLLVPVAAAVAGAVLVPVAGLACAAMVPAAMSTFGTVVAGVGTMHASFAAGGVAATLQVASATLATTEAMAVGGAVGAAAGIFSRRGGGGENNESNPPGYESVVNAGVDETIPFVARDTDEVEEEENHGPDDSGSEPMGQPQ